MSAILDMTYAYKIIKMLSTDWKKQEAYKLGLIDRDGDLIKTPITLKEKAAYGIFDRLVFNLKRLIEKIPLVGKKLGSKALAMLFLLKEHCDLSDEELEYLAEELNLNIVGNKQLLNESKHSKDPIIAIYTLTEDIASPKTGHIIARSGTKIQFESTDSQFDTLFGIPIYEARHINTNQIIYVTSFDYV